MSIEELYRDVFHVDERPFTLLPDPEFLFWTRAHQAAYTVLEYGIMSRAPITVITGEVGAGKTTLVQALLREIDEDTTIGLISNAQGGRGDLLRWVLNALGLTAPEGVDYVALFQILQEFLIGEYAQGRRVIIVIDEAQNLSIEALEELRMMTNINANKDELLQLVLVGQPELRDVVRRPELRQFAQRVVASYHIPEMDARTVGEYIRHRLRCAGGAGTEFDDDAIVRIYESTNGVPRLVNRLCDFSMIYAASSDQNVVTAEVVDQVLAEGFFLTTVDAEGDT